ncbi:MAG: ribonuclease J [Deferrisomatales bacterium]
MAQTRIVPLGGLGEVGLNALAVETAEDLVLVDFGLLFPSTEHGGLDYVVPDGSYLVERRDRFRGVLLTHGHDDHVGAVPHLPRELPGAPIVGTPMTLGLLESRFPEWARGARNRFRALAPGGWAELGAIRAQFIRMTHSVPDACAVALETPGGTVLHSGDFRFDPTPVDGVPADEDRLGQWGDRGVDLLCCDSTNAGRQGPVPSERAVGEAFRRLLPRAPGRVYVATFSSHVHRIQQVVEASRDCGRRVAFLGRSVAQAVRLARRLGRLKTAPGDIVPEHRARGMPRAALTVIVGGSQAEPGSALWRVAHGREPHHRIEPGDLVLISARVIPGNEKAVDRVVNRCIRLGAQVHLGESAGIHVSGHAGARDAVRLLERLRPKHLLPVHGELRHLDALARTAVAWGLAPERVYRGENGQTLVLEGGTVRLGPVVTAGRRYVDRGASGDWSDGLLSERRRLGEEGVAVVVAAYRGLPGELLWGPRVTLRGVAPEDQAAQWAAEAEAAVRSHLVRAAPTAASPEALEAEMARALRRHFRRLAGRRPLIAATAVLG